MSIHYKVLIPVLLISSWAFGQGTPINVQRGSRAVIVNDARFKAQLNLGIPVVADTSNALNGGLDSLGLLIQIRSTGVQYKRDTFPGGHKWTIIGSGGIGGYDSTIMQTIYRSDTAKQAIRNSIAGKQATGNYITSLNTDVVTSGFSGGAAVATIQGHAVTNAKSAQMASRTVKANITGSTADPVDVPIDSLASHITPDSVRFYRKPGSDSVFFCVTPISTGVEKCVFQYHDSIGTGGGSSFDSLTSQGGVFHTGNFNDARYRQTLDTLFAHLLMTRAWGYKISDSIFAVVNTALASKINTVKKIITQTSHGFTVNEPIYLDTTSTTWHAADTTNFAMAVVDSVIGTNSFEATFAGTYNATAHGLSTGKYYYVTMPAGSTTTISPTKSQPVFIPIDANTILVNTHRPVDFSGASSGSGGAVASVNGLTGVVVTKSADSLKKLPIDTSAAPRNGYLLTFDSANHKWYLTAPSTGGTAVTPTLQQVSNTQVAGMLLTKPDTVAQAGFAFKFKGGQLFLDTGTVNNATHTATQRWQVVGGTYTDFINTDLNTVAGSASTMELKQLNMNPPATQAFKLEFQNGGVNTFNAKITGNGNGTLGTQYFGVGANSSNIATPVSAYSGASIQFDTRLLPVMKIFCKYVGATADSLAVTVDTNAVVIIGSQVQAVGSGLLQSASRTKPQLGILYDATHSALFKVNSAGSLDISALTGLTIASGALPTGADTDSSLSESTASNIATIKKVSPRKANVDSVVGSGYSTNAHLYKTIDSLKAVNGTAVKALLASQVATSLLGSTAESSIVGSTFGYGTNTIAANYLTTGKVLRYRMTGTYYTTAITPGNLTIRIKIGGATIATAVITNLAGGVNNASFVASGVIIVGTVSSGSASCYTDGILSYSTGTLLAPMDAGDLNNGGSPTTITTNASNPFDVTAQWATSSSSNIINGLIVTLEAEN